MKRDRRLLLAMASAAGGRIFGVLDALPSGVGLPGDPNRYIGIADCL